MFKSGENGVPYSRENDVPYSREPVNKLQQFSVYVHLVSPLRKC